MTYLHSLGYYQGIRQALYPNADTKLLFRAKFLKDSQALQIIAKRMAAYVSKKNIPFDFIIPVFCSRTRLCFSRQLTKQIAKFLDCSNILYNYFTEPEKYKYIKGKNILLIDDVIQTGTTIKQALYFIEQNQPKNINVLTFLRSPGFKNFRIITINANF